MNKKILKLSIPNIISNITIPLLGMADLAIAGRLGDFSYIGAIGIGVAIFNLIYWNFGFLRMGTSGFTAQAYGARNLDECANILSRALIVACAIAVVILLFKAPLKDVALYVLNSKGDSAALAADYFDIRVWAAPATLSMYAFKGWFIGMQNSKTPMMIAIMMNVSNIATSYIFAIPMGMGVKGIALGTLISQYIGVVISLIVINARYLKIFKNISVKASVSLPEMKKFFKVNRDIFLRTVCLSAVFTFFTSASSVMGDDVLAVNTLLMQLFILFSYFMDGFAYAAEALVGRYTGAKNTKMLIKSVRSLILWGVYLAIPFTLAYLFMLNPILSIFTDSTEVFEASLQFRWWITAVPLASFLAFLYDGIMVGASQSAAMRNAMFVSTAVFFIIYYSTISIIENNALWLSFILYLLLRGVIQAFLFQKEIKKV